MKRDLTKEETKINEKQLIKHKKNLEDLKTNLAYNTELIKLNITKREIDDKYKDYLRARRDEDDKRVLDVITKEIQEEEEHIKILTEQLKNGVEVKRPLAVV